MVGLQLELLLNKRKTVNTVVVNKTTVESKSDFDAVVRTNLTFHKSNGKKADQTIVLYLKWENQSKRWLFDQSKNP